MSTTTRFHDAAGRTLTAGMLAKLEGREHNYGAPCPNSADPRRVVQDMRRRERPAPVFVWPEERKLAEAPRVATVAQPKPQDAQDRYVADMARVRRMAMIGHSQDEISEAARLRKSVVAEMLDLMGITDKWRNAFKARSKVRARARNRSNLGAIIRAVADVTGVPALQIEGQSRRADRVRARHVAMYLAREVTGAGFKVIGRAFEGRDHATVISAWRKIGAALDDDPALRSLVRRCRARVG